MASLPWNWQTDTRNWSTQFSSPELFLWRVGDDRWLTNPQAVIPGAVMAYRQANPATRKQIIDWLKDQH